MSNLSLQKAKVRRARNKARVNATARRQVRAARPRRRRRCSLITKTRFLKALEGTGGVKTRIAERLGCSPSTVYMALDRPGWEDIQVAYLEEVERLVDDAEVTIHYAINQRKDLGAALSAAKWYLARKGKVRGYADESTVRVEGGEPIKTMSLNINVDGLDLPLDVRRQILNAIEEQEGSDGQPRAVGLVGDEADAAGD